MRTQSGTIFALSTPAGGAIALIRASGSLCGEALSTLTGKDFKKKPRQLLPSALFCNGERLDDAMAVYFPGPKSYTGEDMLELHCHGGPAVIRAISQALQALHLRPAEAGEFTKRAFLNGKLDLTQAEAVMDLIEAEASLSARAALEQLQGRLRDDILSVEQLLINALGSISAAIDYPEELEEDVFSDLPAQLAHAQARLASLLEQGANGRILREGFHVVLLGAPNAGKSSLLNAMLGRDRAIVTPIPGTTRDILEEMISIEGIPVVLTDTAGLREAADEAEDAGVRRARHAAAQADALLVLLDGGAPLTPKALAPLAESGGRRRMLLQTKADMPAAWRFEDLGLSPAEAFLPVSAKTGIGIPELFVAIAAFAGPVGGAYVTNSRHIHALEMAHAAVTQAMAAADADCAATDLRDALVALGGITGRAVDESVIENIFTRFCVGK